MNKHTLPAAGSDWRKDWREVADQIRDQATFVLAPQSTEHNDARHLARVVLALLDEPADPRHGGDR